VLTRSLATSFCTLLPISALLFFGGETLKDFAFALLVGIASGTYSSIFIAAPVLTEWKEREPAYRQRRRRIVQDLGFVPPYPVSTTAGVPDAEPAADKGRKRPQPQPVAEYEPSVAEAEVAEVNGDMEEPEEALDFDQEPAPVGSSPETERSAELRAQRAERKKQRARQRKSRKHGRRR
jgi:SecD/SecF fusion protein